ncbi:hypothetical protein STRCI_001649 [Streptomyces cinnabarinus]|uniref:Uncharacterized protein n=1 Tax=Streptomyces cinnabarinus TaxID=67287 RepID=A0ABY7KC76_9ACTN|nr:hypothetical protein [Streptomyces cinnabarinus]WAZ20526.1 hypothetical protein STRCI_001649 [Streptomyces cinnabarinus]
MNESFQAQPFVVLMSGSPTVRLPQGTQSRHAGTEIDAETLTDAGLADGASGFTFEGLTL